MVKLVSLISIAALSVLTLTSQARAASFLDLSAFTAGQAGNFTGTLGGVGVTGTLSSATSNFRILDDSDPTDFGGTTIDDTSPQYSYSSIYTPFQALSDRVGYEMANTTNETATLTLNFSSAVTNPVFHVANLDGMIYDFSSNTGVSLALLSGNGGGGDGLTVDTVNKIIADANPNTSFAWPPNLLPPTTGGRSAYGSIQLLGTFSSLTIDLRKNPNGPVTAGDRGSFILSQAQTVPEPTATLGLLSVGLLGIGLKLKRDRSQK